MITLYLYMLRTATENRDMGTWGRGKRVDGW